MSDLRQRIEPIRSQKYLAGSKGENCKLRFNCCRNERETVVPCHVPDAQRGGARKSDDLTVVDGCWRCHAALDQHTHGLSDGDLFRALLRATHETMRSRWERGLLVIPLDAPTTFHERPVKARKPPDQRKPIPTGRKLKSRNDLRRKPENVT